MLLLDGAVITIRKTEQRKYEASVRVGTAYGKSATADDPIRAIGLAVMLQAGFTENKLRLELEKTS